MGFLAVLATAGVAWTAVPSGPDPAVKEWPAWPYLSQCDYGSPFYAVNAFSGKAEAEKGSLPSQVALRNFLAKGDLPWLRGTRHWRLVVETADRAEFSRGSLTGELEWLTFESDEGIWKWSGYSSDCEPTSIVGGGPVVTWSVADPTVDPGTVARHIDVNLGPGPCASGKPKNPRARLVFKKWGRKLLMTIWLKPLPEGAYTCLGVVEPPLRVTLPRRMKLFRLYDGATYPPRPAVSLNS